MTMLSSSSPVTARTMSGGRAIPARSRTWISVASPCSDDRPELRLELLEAVAPLLDQRHLVAHPDERARDVRADLPAARDDRVHQPAYPALPTGLASQARTTSVSVAIAVCVGQTVRSPRSA